MAGRQPRPTLGALFLLLAAACAGVAFEAGSAAGGRSALWVVAVCAGVIAVWFAGLCVRAFRAG